MQNPSVRRTIDSLILNSHPTDPKLARLLENFSDHFHANPDLVAYLIGQLCQQVEAEGWCSFDLAYANALVHLHPKATGRGYTLPHQIKSLYVRSILRVCPALNGDFEIRACKADKIFGTTIAAKAVHGEHGRRLIWPDDIDYAVPASPQAELFTEAK
jgi:hypothetical protein